MRLFVDRRCWRSWALFSSFGGVVVEIYNILHSKPDVWSSDGNLGSRFVGSTDDVVSDIVISLEHGL